MLNKTLRSTIIVTIQFIVPVAILFTIVPQLLNHSHQLNHVREFLDIHQFQFFLAHCSFYLAFALLWPLLIKITISRQNKVADEAQIKTAISARWYLIAIMAFFELMAWLK